MQTETTYYEYFEMGHADASTGQPFAAYPASLKDSTHEEDPEGYAVYTGYRDGYSNGKWEDPPDDARSYDMGYKAGFTAGYEAKQNELDEATANEIIAMQRDFGAMVDKITSRKVATLTGLYPFNVHIEWDSSYFRPDGTMNRIYEVTAWLSMDAGMTEQARQFVQRDALIEWLKKTGWQTTDFTITKKGE